jgi:hypothetical protein
MFALADAAKRLALLPAQFSAGGGFCACVACLALRSLTPPPSWLALARRSLRVCPFVSQVHKAVETCCTLRPSVDISTTGAR